MEGMVTLRKLGGRGVRILLVEMKLVEGRRNQHDVMTRPQGPAPGLVGPGGWEPMGPGRARPGS